MVESWGRREGKNPVRGESQIASGAVTMGIHPSGRNQAFGEESV